MKIAHRRDVDGLRGLAVIAVILNHAHVSGFGGGFLGVDVFFVISGFLITRILVKSDGTLGQNILSFYERRVRRIAPALITVLAVSTIIALALLSPLEMRQYGASLAASASFAANLFFMRGTNYFAPRYDTPLLHLWSLGVEEQFYILFPLLVWITARYARQRLIFVLLVLFFLSLVLSEWLISHDRVAAFYFTGSRAWEILLGAIVAMLPWRFTWHRHSEELLALAGISAIILPIAISGPRTNWPGVNALLPCLGTALLIALHEKRATVVGRLLSASLPVGIGLISYSLYLWHWPLFEFYQRFQLRQPGELQYACLIGVAFVLAWLSWRFIEQPFRKPGIGRNPVFAAAASFLVLCLCFESANLYWGGFPQRFAPDVAKTYAYLGATFISPGRPDPCFAGPSRPFDLAKCFKVVPDKPNVVLWGDSHAENYFVGLRAQAQKAGINLVQATDAACTPILQDPATQTNCAKFNREVFERLDGRITAVIISGQFNRTLVIPAPFVRTVEKIAAKGIHVIVIGQSLQYFENEPIYIARYEQTGDKHVLDLARSQVPGVARIDANMSKALQNKPRVTYVSVIKTVCRLGPCPVDVGGVPTAFDNSHMTGEASLAFGILLWPQIYGAIRDASGPGKL